MAPVPFIFPPTLYALEADDDDGVLSAQNPTDVSSLRPSQLEDFVKGQRALPHRRARRVRPRLLGGRNLEWRRGRNLER
ncbi:condensin-1 complex subunit CAP-D2-like isoform X2 [Rhododendron vialii]|uniref:condensin-1 complex subunit CAP-D2-like isoform X2 n=1 Tax=Rhododendron vialii TaxID=182163 RepID=UPI00265EF5A5|nr:condensin-1 complex subunit CAP-D2-like isoform X2 [Rhododendron vialii]